MMPLDSKATLVCQHIPKTAGTTFRAILENIYSDRELISVESPEQVESLTLNEEQRVELKMIMGHASEWFPRRYPGKYQFITFVRDPFSRLVSHYDYIRRTRADPHHSAVIEMSLMDFVTSDIRQDDYQARLISWPFDDIQRHPRLLKKREELKIWMREVLEHHYFLVGLVERFDESLVLMKRMLGWPFYPHYTRLQQAGESRKSAIPVDIAALIRERYLVVDSLLYEWANDELDAQIAKQGSDYFDELERFRQAQERIDRLVRQAVAEAAMRS